MPALPRYSNTFEDYLSVEEEAPAVRHQFINGDIVAVAGGSRLHSALIAAMAGELYVQLRGKRCGPCDSNMRVRVAATENAFCTDGLVVCGRSEVVHEIRSGDSLLNPTLIFEVVSPSSEKYDRGEKFNDNYRLIPSLRAYVLVSQEERLIEVRSRAENGSWTVSEHRGGEIVQLESIDAVIDVDAVYTEAEKNA